MSPAFCVAQTAQLPASMRQAAPSTRGGVPASPPSSLGPLASLPLLPLALPLPLPLEPLPLLLPTVESDPP
jgi:hypothetical protein